MTELGCGLRPDGNIQCPISNRPSIQQVECFDDLDAGLHDTKLDPPDETR
jgi:hypothetical protein